jgi:hypothetical protein
MECKDLRRKLSAYMDHELPVEEMRLIETHLSECTGCAKELQLLTEQNAYLQKAEQLAVPADFKARFWQKVRTLEEKGIAVKSIWDGVFERFIPVPVIAAFIVVVFSAFTLFSPIVYGMQQDVKRDIPGVAVTLLAGEKVFAPLNFVKFCDNCHCMLCKNCHEGNECTECKCK